MECEEEEQDVTSKDRDEEETDRVEAREEREDKTPARIIPLQPLWPIKPVQKCSGSPLSFKVNGQLVPLLPAGVELKLRFHPGGSASGFTTVHVPFSAETHRHHSSITCQTTTPPSAAPTLIITGVVSGEAAEMVLSKHTASIRSSTPMSGSWTTSVLPRGSVTTTPTASKIAPQKRPRKGLLEPTSPPECLVCRCQYKLITELRGFLCLCSPAISASLKNLKKRKKQRRRSRERNKMWRTFREPQTFSKVSKTRPGPGSTYKVVSPVQRTHRTSDDFLSKQPNSPLRPSQQEQPEVPPDPHGKLVVMVEDFYYGSTPQPASINHKAGQLKFTGPYRCIHCPEMLHNNIMLMNHMQQHASTTSLQDMEAPPPTCPHCFRHFLSPFKLQCHLKAVHTQCQSWAKCEICEMAFDSEPAFLWHMKKTHRPGEMPYVCQVCDFRSSFYSDLWSHFERFHAGSHHLLCQYCLRVLHTSTCYQQHFTRHQKKHVFSCDKCRLHFLFMRECIEHKQLHHGTHIRPAQLCGLKPGTKVTVRTYSVAGGLDKEGMKQVSPSKVVDVDPLPPTQEAPKRKTVEILGPLLSTLNQDSEAVSVSHPSQRCVECLSWFQDFRSHFPSMVRCSLCRFITCCSTSYANHMINNHTIGGRRPRYESIFQSDQRFSQTLKCASCTLTTCRGDMLANHLTERPDHDCAVLPHTDQRVCAVSEPSVNGGCTMNTPPSENCSVTSSPVRGGGAFIPIHLLPSHQTTQLSVKTLTSPSPLSSPSAMTVTFMGPPSYHKQGAGSPLSAFQLQVVCFSLCHGLALAFRQYGTVPQKICSWIQEQECHRLESPWAWRTEKLAEWILSQREQQLAVSDGTLLQMAKEALRVDNMASCYSWIADFLLRHGLSVHPMIPDSAHLQQKRLPRNIRDNSRVFIELLSAQIQTKAPHLVASMDEFPIFINMEHFVNQNPAALQLSHSSKDIPVFNVVLSALSDGTFLPPVVLFKGTPVHVPEGFPDNVLLEVVRDRVRDLDCHRIWINKVWKPHVFAPRQPLLQSAVIVDIHRGHLSDDFRSHLGSMSTNVFFIPSGCCCRLQPLDVCVTPVLRDFLQARWLQLVSQGGLDGLGLNQLGLTLACWLSEVSSILNSNTHFLRRSFSSVWGLQGSEDQEDAAMMIQELSQVLVQPVDSCQPPPNPQPQFHLLLVMEQENLREEKMQQEETTGEGGVKESPRSASGV